MSDSSQKPRPTIERPTHPVPQPLRVLVLVGAVATSLIALISVIQEAYGQAGVFLAETALLVWLVRPAKAKPQEDD